MTVKCSAGKILAINFVCLIYRRSRVGRVRGLRALCLPPRRFLPGRGRTLTPRICFPLSANIFITFLRPVRIDPNSSLSRHCIKNTRRNYYCSLYCLYSSQTNVTILRHVLFPDLLKKKEGKLREKRRGKTKGLPSRRRRRRQRRQRLRRRRRRRRRVGGEGSRQKTQRFEQKDFRVGVARWASRLPRRECG